MAEGGEGGREGSEGGQGRGEGLKGGADPTGGEANCSTRRGGGVAAPSDHCSASACSLAESGNLLALSALPSSSLHAPDKHGNSAIHWAAGGGHLPLVKWLIERGFAPDSRGSLSSRSKRRSPLHYAARNGRLEVVQFLCETASVDPDPRDSQSVSPFQLAVRRVK